jgi:hypothetical protein
MKQAVIFVSLLVLGYSLQAQQGYFISIDADDNQFFSVKLGKKFYSSSSIGHLVIPNLKDSTYQLTFNFPQSSYKEQSFTITIDKKDKGFRLKKNAEKSWSLLDWQTMVWIRADGDGPARTVSTPVKEAEKPLATPAANTSTETVTKSTGTAVAAPAQDKSKDAFARLMAAVVNDTAVLFNTTLRVDKAKKAAEEKARADSAIAAKRKADSLLVVEKQKRYNDSVANVVRLQKEREEKTRADELAESKRKADSIATVRREKREADSLAFIARAQKEMEEKSKRVDPPAGDKKIVTTETSKADSSVTDDRKIDARAGDTVARAPVRSMPDSNVTVVQPRKESPEIKLLRDLTTPANRELVFTDRHENAALDTIRIFIPVDTSLRAEQKAIDSPLWRPRENETANDERKEAGSVKKDSAGVISPRSMDKDSGAVAANKAPADSTRKSEPAPEKKVVIINSDCKQFASESDVDKLRIRMLGESNLDERIAIARKVFRTKCFTARQIRALSELFVNDKTRYSFFDAAYPFVSDTDNFKGLIDLLTDEYYIGRFRAMVRM